MTPKRVDANQAEIVADLRAIGATVQHLHEVGDGCPDILVGFRDRNYLFEIKGPKGLLTAKQRAWHDAWRGQAWIISSIKHALEVMDMVSDD